MGHNHMVIVGLCNILRGDDGAGPYVIELLKKEELENVNLVIYNGEGIDLLQTWAEYDRVILVDAVSSGAEPGTIVTLKIPGDKIPKNIFGSSTHTIDVADVIRLGETLGLNPGQITIFGIEGKSFGHGTDLSFEVKEAAKNVVKEIRSNICTK